MGTSILLIFIIPAAIFQVIFSYISGAFMGYPTAKVELPYDEATGLVWEYDNVDDPYINLVETETKDGNQGKTEEVQAFMIAFQKYLKSQTEQKSA